MKEKALDAMCRQSPDPRNGSQERSILSEFLPPAALNTGDVHPDMVPEEKSGQDKPHCLPAAPQLFASHHPESRPGLSPVYLRGPPAKLQSLQSLSC